MKKQVKNYKGLYFIYSEGIVMNRNGYEMKGHDNGKGYLRVALTKNGKCNFYLIHKLLAIHFIPNLNNENTVNHKNGNKKDNSLINLEWMSQSENCKHAFRTKLKINPKGEKHPKSKLKEVDVLKIRKLINQGKPMTKIASIYNVRPQTIDLIKRKINWKHI